MFSSTQNVSKNVANNVANKLNSTLVNTTKNVSSASTSFVDSLKQKMEGKLPILVVIAVTVLIFVLVIVYISFAMKNSNLKGKVLLATPLKLDKEGSPVVVPGTDIPKPQVGREYAFSFWVYLENFLQDYDNVNNKPNHKLIFYRGNADDMSVANPIVLVDGLSNKLYVVIKTSESTLGPDVNTNPNVILSNNYFLSDKSLDDSSVNKHLILPVDYIPLQRWVHIGFVVDNKIATVYMDGEIYSVKSVDEFKSSKKPHVNRLGKTLDYNLIIDKTEGDVNIGKSKNNSINTINGFLSKLEFYNYAVTSGDMKKIYQNGPSTSTNSLFKTIGLAGYGARFPIYKIANESS